jgi:hypothetical protein
MPRKPSAAVPRSETTAELIARISAERDAPPTSDHRAAGRSRAGVLDAPGVTRRSTARAAGLPRPRSAPDDRRPSRSEELRDRGSEPTVLPLRRSDGAGHDRVRPDDDVRAAAPSGRRALRTGDGRPDDDAPTAAPRSRRALRSVGGVGGEIDTGPEPDDTPTVVIGYLEPIAPRQRGLVRRIVPGAIAVTALVGISIAIAQGFTFPGFTDSEPVTPAPAGPTVPAPVNGPDQDAAPAAVDEPAADEPAEPQSEVTVTDAAVPPSDYTY